MENILEEASLPIGVIFPTGEVLLNSTTCGGPNITFFRVDIGGRTCEDESTEGGDRSENLKRWTTLYV